MICNDRFGGSHDHENPVENIALSMTQPASSKSSLKDRDTQPGETCHAACADDDVSQDGRGGSDQSLDDAAAALDPPAGSDARRCRESFRDDGGDGEHGSGTPEPTLCAAKPDDQIPRCPKEGRPRFNWRFNQCRRLSLEPTPQSPPSQSMPMPSSPNQ